jgi:LysM repeat protein
LATSEDALTSADPTNDEPFPANLETDTGTASDDAALSPVDVRFGVHEDFDRVVVDLTGTGTPGWTVEYTEAPTAQGSGQPVDVAGDAVLAVRIDGVVMPTEDGAEEWQGPERLAPQSAGVVQEVVHGTIFEGVQTLYIGLESQEPFRAFDLQEPTRLVIDIYHPDVTGGAEPLPGDDPAEDLPFPANLEPDTNEVSDGAMLSPVDLRLGVHEEYDRVVLDLAGEGVPGWLGEYVENPTLQGSGAPVELEGDASLKVIVRGVVYPTAQGAEEYQGPQRIDPEATGVVQEVVYGSVFEGQTEIFIGLQSQEPFRVFRLEDPTRVVIDIVHPSAGTPPGTYVVQPGDTLSSIAAGYDATWQQIYDANRATIGPDPDLIQAGQQLTIPGG